LTTHFTVPGGSNARPLLAASLTMSDNTTAALKTRTSAFQLMTKNGQPKYCKLTSFKSLQTYRISTLSCLQHGSFNVEEAGNCVHFIVYSVKKNSETPNRDNDSSAITLPNSSRAGPKTENYATTSSNKIKTNYNF